MRSAPVPTARRRTQHERREATRTALLDATVACLVEDGYAGTTTRRVAQRAGVSVGALQHHYAGKQELVSEAIAHLTRQLSAALVERGMPAAKSRQEITEELVDRLWEIVNGPLIEAATELAVAGRTDPALRERLGGAQRGAVEMVGVTARQLLPDESEHAGLVGLISTVLAAMRGMAMLGFVNPKDRDAAWAAGRPHLLGMVAAWERGL